MTEPKHLVSDILDALAVRLDPIIQARLDADLDGLAWPVVLSELDRLKGVSVKSYSRTDVQAQLRVLTERLGALKFPFDDSHRTVSTLGGELRIVRNAFAHGDDLTWLDAFRAADFGVRLLEHFGDGPGRDQLVALREAALPQMAVEQGMTLDVATERVNVPTSAFAGEGEPAAAPEVLASVPPVALATVGTTLGGHRGVVGDQLPAFEPWPVVIVGESSVIDALPKKVAKLQVRAVAAEIAEYEGPVQLDRLARLTVAAFGWKRLTASRRKQIAYQIRQVEGIAVDGHGFVWPQGLVAGEWSGFRPAGSADVRAFSEISPHEIANAAAYVRAAKPGLDDQALRREVLALFGRHRLTAGVAAHLDVALASVR